MRVAMYWHNGRSLGHTAESAKVAHGLTSSNPAVSIAGLTGAHKGLDLLPQAVDVVKLPAFTNYDDPAGWSTTGRLPIGTDELFAMRAEMIEVFLRHYQPENFLVNHLPQGAEGELINGLRAHRTGHRILTLRGVLFNREKTHREYFAAEPARWIDEHFDRIHVHIHPEVFRLEEYYEIPDYLQERIRYTGYLARQTDLSRPAARESLGLDDSERLVVMSMGGGQGALALWSALLDSLEDLSDRFDRVRLVTGPYLEPSDAETLRKRSAELPWLDVVSYEPDMSRWMVAADLFVGAAGSNMLAEILSTGCNSVVVPRQVREDEQRIHSRLLQQRGLVRRCDLPDVLDGQVTPVLRAAFEEPLAPKADHMVGGADRYADLLEGLNDE